MTTPDKLMDALESALLQLNRHIGSPKTEAELDMHMAVVFKIETYLDFLQRNKRKDDSEYVHITLSSPPSMPERELWHKGKLHVFAETPTKTSDDTTRE